MRLKNKKTGEIREIKEVLIDRMFKIKSLAELNEEWEDYEDTQYWCINWAGVNGVIKSKNPLPLKEEFDKEIGNYFESGEEAEKALEKLKAWKRLKDTITRVDRASFDDVGTATLFIRYKGRYHKKVKGDLDLLFSEVKNDN